MPENTKKVINLTAKSDAWPYNAAGFMREPWK